MDNQRIIDRFNANWSVGAETLEDIANWAWGQFKPWAWTVQGSPLTDTDCLTQEEYEKALEQKYIKLAMELLNSNSPVIGASNLQDIVDEYPSLDINDEDLVWIKTKRNYNLTPFTKNTIAN